MLSGIIFVDRNGLRWCDAPIAYGPRRRWGERRVFLRTMKGLAAAETAPETAMIDAIYLKAHRTASSLEKRNFGRLIGCGDGSIRRSAF